MDFHDSLSLSHGDRIFKAKYTDDLARQAIKNNKSGPENITPKGIESPEPAVKWTQQRVARTACVVVMFMANGLSGGIATTASVDLVSVLGVTIDRLSASISTRAMGQMAGSFLAPRVMRRYSAHAPLIMAVMTAIEGLTFAFVPWMRWMWLLALAMLVRGVVHGVAFIIAGTQVISDWGANSAMPVNAMYFGASVGLLIGPMVTSPFLSQEVVYQNATFNSTVSTESRVIIPYLVSGGFNLLSAALFIILFLKGWDPAPSIEPQTESLTESSTATRKQAKVILSVMFLIIFIVMQWKEALVSSFLFYIAVESSLQIPKARAAVLNTMNMASWVIGRLLGVLLARCIRINILLFLTLLFTCVVSVFLTLYGLKQELNLWIIVALFQIFSGPTYASILSWADRYIRVTGFFMSVIEFANGIGELTLLAAGGLILEKLGARYVFMASSVAAFLVLVLISILQIWFHFKLSDRFVGESLITRVSGDELTEDERTESVPLLK